MWFIVRAIIVMRSRNSSISFYKQVDHVKQQIHGNKILQRYSFSALSKLSFDKEGRSLSAQEILSGLGDLAARR